MNAFLLPPPNTFPDATIYIAGAMRTRFRPFGVSDDACIWTNDTKCLAGIAGGLAAYVGSIAHVWKGAPWGAKDGWGIIQAYGAPCPGDNFHIPTLDIPTDVGYQMTVSLAPPYNIQGIWDRIRATVGLTVPGAIRWAALWLKVITPNLTHSLNVMHFDGMP